jgi:protease secretion system membrane fusion protein
MKIDVRDMDVSEVTNVKLLPQKQPSGLLGWLNPYDPDRLRRDGIEPIRIEESRIKGKAARMLLVAFIAFAIWAMFAPIDSGANVSGTVVVMGNRKAVQHPSGGVVEEIFVHEGAMVHQGDVLIKLNRLSIDAGLNSTELDYINVVAAESRLVSERENLQTIVWLPELGVQQQDQVVDKRVDEARRQQIRLFLSRKEEIEGQLRILREQIAGLTAQAAELQKIIAARREQMLIMAVEAKNNNELAAEGFVPRSRANEVERARSDLLASIATTSSELGKTQSNIAATRLQLHQTVAVYRRDLETQLAETQKLRGALRAKVDSLKFDLSLTELRAPVTGTVVGLKANTVGGVIQGGVVLMEIVPSEGNLVVDAQVSPNLIDKVKVGLEADMRFSAFNVNTTPVIPGKIRVVGADRLPATSKEQPFEYYLVQIETTREGFKLLGDSKVQAGMPVDVVIKTGERTFMSYLFKPLSDRFAKSFKEG